MKKLFIPTALSLLLATALVAEDAKKPDAAASAPAAPAKTEAAPAAPKADAKAAEAAHPAAAHPAATPAKKSGAHHRHHSNVNVKVANELTDKLNKMTCPCPATPVAAAHAHAPVMNAPAA
ncbi:hypothetical protein [Candidatus Finniella inopinata]|uniref:hypothetical protein n=1 Tax=Candidatus Finniella inopinata TaxID=1696036 RepID=UPI0013EE5A19|nr:hypothetical protein [Candidatus Finniella inopinata]